MDTDCSLAEDSAPLRQGDIFAWVDRAYTRPWRTFGVVITADCDLEQKKTKGVLSFLPALTFEDYIWSFWRTERFSPILDKLRTKAIDRLNKVLVRLRADRKPISTEAALAWIGRTSSDGLANEVGLTDAGQIRDFCSVIDSFKAVQRLLETDAPDIALLNKCYALHRGVVTPEDFSDLARDVQSKISSLPGDVFFVSGVDGIERFGLFVMLRHISQCNVDDVAVRPADLRWGGAKARRMARVNAPYKFALAQNMARVFLDIGLPSSYSERQKTSSAKYFEACGDNQES